MADREQSQTSKREMDQKPQRDVAGTSQQTGSQSAVDKEHEHGIKSGGTVGREVPDLSKEKNTEIAIEAGHTGGERRDEKP